MPNEQNLEKGIATQFKSGEEAVENGRKGGIASGESKRRRKTLKEELLLMLENEDVQRSVAAALINEAIEGNNSGSVARAFETIRDTIGEKPVDKVMIADVDPAVINEVEDEVRRFSGSDGSENEDRDQRD